MMTIEEKARAYDEALEKARKHYNSKYHPSEGPSGVYLNNADLEEIFPALKESEDERMMEAIEGTIRTYGKTQGEWIGGYDMDTLVVHLRKAFDALKKQKEKKPFPKFKVGDTIHCKYDNREFTVKSVDLTNMVYKYTEEGCGNDIDYADEEFELVEPKPAEWSEDIIRKAVKKVGLTQHQIDWFKTNVFPPKQEWNEEDKETIEKTICILETNFKPNEGFTGLDINRSQLVDRLNSLRPQPKQEWSEEDEANLDYLIDFCNSCYNGNTRPLTRSIAGILSGWLYRVKSGEILLPKSRLDEKDDTTIHLACEFIRHHSTKIDSIGGIDCSELVKRLKSLRPQLSWRPSEEQMRAVFDASERNDKLGSVLTTLYSDLKNYFKI